MANFPKLFAFPDPLVHISTFSACSLGSMYITSATPGSAIYPSANLAIFVPFRLSRPFSFSKLFVDNGSVVSGNIDIGVYSADGTKIISTGSTAQTGTNVVQSITVTTTEIGAGLFYLAVAMNNVTGTLIRQAPTAPKCQVMGMAQMATAFPLPATATFASITNGYIPFMGIAGRSTL